LRMFFEDCCILEPRAEASASELHRAYVRWAISVGEEAMKTMAFETELGNRGFESFRYPSGQINGRRGWRGIGLIDDAHPPDCRGSTGNGPAKSGNKQYQKVENASLEAPMTPKEDLVRSATQESPRDGCSIRIDIRLGAIK
jgi:hypothetical protein